MAPSAPNGPQVLEPHAEVDGDGGVVRDVPAEPKTHVMEKGETLAEVSHRFNHHGEQPAIWEANLGADMGGGRRFGDFQHMVEGGMPEAGWVITLPQHWSEPKQPEPAAIVSDADKMAETLLELKTLAAKLGITL